MSEAVNKAELLEIMDNDLELIQDLYDAACEEGPVFQRGIEEAIAEKDAEKLRLNAHALRGMLKNFYANPAVDLANDLEQMGAQKNLDGAEAKLVELQAEIPRVHAALEAILAGG